MPHFSVGSHSLFDKTRDYGLIGDVAESLDSWCEDGSTAVQVGSRYILLYILQLQLLPAIAHI